MYSFPNISHINCIFVNWRCSIIYTFYPPRLKKAIKQLTTCLLPTYIRASSVTYRNMLYSFSFSSIIYPKNSKIYIISTLLSNTSHPISRLHTISITFHARSCSYTGCIFSCIIPYYNCHHLYTIYPSGHNQTVILYLLPFLALPLRNMLA